MRSSRRKLLVVLIILITSGAGVASMSHLDANADPATAALPIPAPTEAAKWIGRPPQHAAAQATDPPAVLGTVFLVGKAGTRAVIQAVSVDDIGATADSRHLIRIQVSGRALEGETTLGNQDFALLDFDGKRYSSQPAKATGDVPTLGTVTLQKTQTVDGALFFDVPTTASALTLAYAPGPPNKVVGSWMLAAP